MIIFQGTIGPVAGKAEASSLAVIKKEHVEVLAILSRIDAALQKGDLAGANDALQDLRKLVPKTREVSKNEKLALEIRQLEKNIKMLIPGTEQNKEFLKDPQEKHPKDYYVFTKDEILSFAREGAAYMKEDLLKTGVLLCLYDAISTKSTAEIKNTMYLMATAQSPEDYLRILDPNAKSTATGLLPTTVFYTDYEMGGKSAQKAEAPEARQQIGPLFPGGSSLAQVDKMVGSGDYEGAKKMVGDKCADLTRLAPLGLRLDPIAYQPPTHDASLKDMFREGGEMFVPLWGGIASTVRAVRDFDRGMYTLGAINSASALLMFGMDAATIISLGRVKGPVDAIKKGTVKWLARLGEKEFEKTIVNTTEKALSKELSKGISKATMETLEKEGGKEAFRLFEKVRTNVLKAVEKAGKNLSKKDLEKIASEETQKIVENELRATAANQQALIAESVLAGKGPLGKKAGKAVEIAKEEAPGLLKKVRSHISNYVKKSGEGARKEKAGQLREKAGKLREDGKRLMTDKYTPPFMTKLYKPWKMLIWPGKQAQGLTARALEREAWTLEKSVVFQQWINKGIGRAESRISPYFRPMSVAVYKYPSYWWARGTNLTSITLTNLPGSKLDQWMGLPVKKAENWLDGVAGLAFRKRDSPAQTTTPEKSSTTLEQRRQSAISGTAGMSWVKTRAEAEALVDGYINGVYNGNDKEAELGRMANGYSSGYTEYLNANKSKSTPAKQESTPAPKLKPSERAN